MTIHPTKTFLFLILSLGLIFNACHNPEKVLPKKNGHWFYEVIATTGSNSFNYSGEIFLKEDFTGRLSRNDWFTIGIASVFFNWSYDKSTKEITLEFPGPNYTQSSGQNWKYKITKRKAKTEKWEGDVISGLSGTQYHHVMTLTYIN